MLAVIGFLVGVVLAGVGVFLWQEKRRAVLLSGIGDLEGKIQSLTQDSANLRESAARAAAERDGAVIQRSETLVTLQERESEIERFRSQLIELNQTVSELQKEQALLEQQRLALEEAKNEQKALLQTAEERLKDAFQALSGEALSKNNENFLSLAKTSLSRQQEEGKGELEKRQQAIENLVKPIEERLEKLADVAHEMEKKRSEAYGNISNVIDTMTKRADALQKEANNLVNALKMPVRRGQWGEVQLRNVVEMAGMLQYCDFEEQKSVNTETGRLRPDMTVRMPGNRTIVVDSKVSLAAYLEAIEQEDEEQRRELFKRHSVQVRTHVTSLSTKDYQRQFETAPDFVVMFLPGEPFYSAALEQDPSLIEFATKNNVIISTPTTLIALLRAIEYGWRQVNLEQDAKRIAELGQTLFERLAKMGDHIARVGKNLDSAVESYNEMIGSLERRVLPTARQMRDLKGFTAAVEMKELEPIAVRARSLDAPDMPALPFDDDSAS